MASTTPWELQHQLSQPQFDYNQFISEFGASNPLLTKAKVETIRNDAQDEMITIAHDKIGQIIWPITKIDGTAVSAIRASIQELDEPYRKAEALGREHAGVIDTVKAELVQLNTQLQLTTFARTIFREADALEAVVAGKCVETADMAEVVRRVLTLRANLDRFVKPAGHALFRRVDALRLRLVDLLVAQHLCPASDASVEAMSDTIQSVVQLRGHQELVANLSSMLIAQSDATSLKTLDDVVDLVGNAVATPWYGNVLQASVMALRTDASDVNALFYQSHAVLAVLRSINELESNAQLGAFQPSDLKRFPASYVAGYAFITGPLLTAFKTAVAAASIQLTGELDVLVRYSARESARWTTADHKFFSSCLVVRDYAVKAFYHCRLTALVAELGKAITSPSFTRDDAGKKRRGLSIFADVQPQHRETRALYTLIDDQFHDSRGQDVMRATSPLMIEHYIAVVSKLVAVFADKAAGLVDAIGPETDMETLKGDISSLIGQQDSLESVVSNVWRLPKDHQIVTDWVAPKVSENKKVLNGIMNTLRGK